MHEYCCSAIRLSSDEIHRSLGIILGDILGKQGLGEISLLGSPKPVADDTTKFLVTNIARQPALVVICSPPIAPSAVASGVESATIAVRMLGDQLAYPILKALAHGSLADLSYAVWAYCTPLSEQPIISRIQNILLRKSVFYWLRQATAQTVRPINSTNLDTSVLAPLRHLASNMELPPAIRKTAQWSINRSQTGQWKPVHVLMHNDFWRGNLLIRPRQPEVPTNWSDRFAIIDWSGCVHKGYGIYDLLRMAGSLHLSGQALKHELHVHCHILRCDPDDAISHLFAALGWLGLHLEHFPRDRYVRLVSNCFAQLLNLGMTPKLLPEVQAGT